MTDLYQSLDIRPVINANATLTKLGGSLMPQPVKEAMMAASGNFIDIFEMHEKVGKRLAQLTKNEAAYVSSGAAAGIVQTVATCIVGGEADARFLFPQLEGITRKEVVLFKGQRNGYDYAVAQTGATVVESGPTEEDLKSVLGPNTAALVYFHSARWADASPPLKRIVEICHAAGVPVIVDAAAQIPPITNLWYFTQECGADVAIFSGGKGLRGPQPTGLVIGKQWIIDGCRNHAAPNQSFGRPMKVGKEEMVGLLAAVEWSLKQNEPETIAGYEASVKKWVDGLSGIPGVTAERSFPSEAGQPHARAMVTLTGATASERDTVIDTLWNRNPRISVAPIDDDKIALNPQTLFPGQDDLVLAAMREVLTARASRG